MIAVTAQAYCRRQNENCLFSGNETDLFEPEAGQGYNAIYSLKVFCKTKSGGPGMDDFTDFADPKHNQQNRSMITIGGKIYQPTQPPSFRRM